MSIYFRVVISCDTCGQDDYEPYKNSLERDLAIADWKRKGWVEASHADFKPLHLCADCASDALAEYVTKGGKKKTR